MEGTNQNQEIWEYLEETLRELVRKINEDL